MHFSRLDLMEEYAMNIADYIVVAEFKNDSKNEMRIFLDAKKPKLNLLRKLHAFSYPRV